MEQFRLRKNKFFSLDIKDAQSNGGSDLLNH